MKKKQLEEFWGDVPENVEFAGAGWPHKITVKTRIRDAEKLALKRIRSFAKLIGHAVIKYTYWSGQNPDFLNGTDRTPKEYTIEAMSYTRVKRT